MPTNEAPRPAQKTPVKPSRIAALLRWPPPRMVMLIGGAILILFVGGGLLIWQPWQHQAHQQEVHEPEQEKEKSPPQPPPKETKSPSGESREAPASADLDEIDLLLRSGRFEVAAETCRPAAESALAGLRDAFGYRYALALEGMGRWDDSIRTYRQVASHQPGSPLAAAALLGQGRVWLRASRFEPGKAILSEIILRSGDPLLADQPLVSDARYLLALAQALGVLDPGRLGADSETPASHSPLLWPVDRAVDWGSLPRSSKTLPPNQATPDSVTVRTIGKEEQFLVTLSVHQTRLASLLAQLAEKARVKLEWSAGARQLVEDRMLAIDLQSVPLGDFLRMLSDRVGLHWRIESGTLYLYSDQDARTETYPLRLAQARKSLQDAVTRDPDNPLSPCAFLELGNLEAKAGHNDESMNWYARLLRDAPRSPLVTEAHLNRGILQMQMGRSSLARQTFYRVVDRASGHQLTARAYFLIGRLHLEDYQPDLALSPLRRALEYAKSGPLEPVVALTTAAAHLLSGNPRTANRILVDYKTQVGRPEHRRCAAFLDTLARFRMATEERLRKRELNDLVTSLIMYQDNEPLGPACVLLKVQAYMELGMPDAVISLAVEALRTMYGPLAIEMSSAIANAYLQTDRPLEAARLYGTVADTSSKQAPVARRRLAEIALKEGKPQISLRWGYRCLKDVQAEEAAPILRLIAGAYEALGQRDRAILTLSGKPPALEEQTQPANPTNR